MSEGPNDRFFERLREEARVLRFEPDEVMTSRIAARVRARVAAPAPTAAQFLARWFRPVTATFSAIALAAAIGLVLLEKTASQDASADSLAASSSIEISAAGDVYSVGD